MKLKNGMKVIAPEGCEEWLTAGKEYEVFNVKNEFISTSFYIISDYNIELLCLLEGCAHLNCKNWIIKNEAK